MPRVGALLAGAALGSNCLHGKCAPGNEFCGEPFKNAPMFHLMDQHGCGENDPNGPVFDPVHGVIHHFYQIHLATGVGHGPDYGHFVSKDFVHWAPMPVAIWNGIDSSVDPPRETVYDSEAIFTGSAVVVDGAGPGGKGKGVVNIYPGLCNKKTYPQCETGTLLAQAVPANYATDELLTNWTKPLYNPIIQNTQRDPSTPWKTAHGEWRLRTYDSSVYGSASDADLLEGKWYEIGRSKDFRRCECPSFYPLPAATPGFEKEYAAADLPTHVHKTSCGGDWWQMGTYNEGTPKVLGEFASTPGWEDVFAQRKIDVGAFYASKDNAYPTAKGEERRINWGWAQVQPASAQTLPRVITFNAAARVLEQAPLPELEALRGPAAVSKTGLPIESYVSLAVPAEVVRQSETVATFTLPKQAATFGVNVGQTNCTVAFVLGGDGDERSSAINTVDVACGNKHDKLNLLKTETELSIRIFADATFLEVYFQNGRVAMTIPSGQVTPGIEITSTEKILANVDVYPMKSIWVTPDEVRGSKRVFPEIGEQLDVSVLI